MIVFIPELSAFCIFEGYIVWSFGMDNWPLKNLLRSGGWELGIKEGAQNEAVCRVQTIE